MHKQSFLRGVTYMVLSATGLSIVGLFGKLAQNDMPLTALVFYRFSAAFVLCLLLYLLIGKLKKNFSAYPIKSNLLRMVLMLGAQYCFYSYIRQGSLLNGMALLNTGPLFIPFIERIFLGRKIGRSTWISIVVSFIGVLMILQPDKGVFSYLGIVGMSAGLFQGGSQVIFGINSRGENVELSVLVLFALCAIGSFIPFLFSSPSLDPFVMDTNFMFFLVIGLALGSIFNQLSRAEAYKHSTPSRLASFLYFSVVLAGVYDWVIFKQPPNLLSCIGAGLVIFGGVLKIVLRQRAQSAQEKKVPPL